VGGGFLALAGLFEPRLSPLIALASGVFNAAIAHKGKYLSRPRGRIIAAIIAVGLCWSNSVWAGICQYLLCKVDMFTAVSRCAGHDINATIFIGLSMSTLAALIFVFTLARKVIAQ
jgi:hypothetical protein